MLKPKYSWKENLLRPTTLLSLGFLLLSVCINPNFHSPAQTHVHIKNWYIPRSDLSLVLLLIGVLLSWLNHRHNFRTQSRLLKLLSACGLILCLASAGLSLQRMIQNTLVMSAGEQQLSALELAAYHGDLAEVRNLVKNESDTQVRNQVSKTALHFACGASPVINQVYRGSPQVAEFLISQGANVNAQDAAGNTPLMDAIANHNLDCVQVLLSHRAELELKNQYGKSALDQAKTYKDEPILQALLQAQKQ